MRVSQVAEELGITPDTVRFYSRLKLLTPSINPQNAYKEYSPSDIRRLKFIVAARQLGFTVDDITTILGKADDHQSPCPTVRNLIEKRLEETEKQFQDLVALRARMNAAIALWEQIPDRVPTGHMICHMIENFSEAYNNDTQQ